MKESERDRVCKLVNFQYPRSWKTNDLDAAYEASSAYAWEGRKATEKHNVFIFSADLIHETGNAWAKTSEWRASYGEECVKFMRSKKGHADLLVFCNGPRTTAGPHPGCKGLSVIAGPRRRRRCLGSPV